MVHYTILPANIASCSIPYWYFPSYSEEQIAYVLNPISETDFLQDIPLATSIKELAKLSNVSSLEKTYHILHEDDRELSCILKNCLTAPTVPKETSESE